MKTLYRITIRKPEDFYVVADNPTQAYDKVSCYLENNDFYFRKDRELRTIEVIAEDYKYTNYHKLVL